MRIITLAIIIAVFLELIHILLDVYILKHIKIKNKILAQCKVVLSFVISGFIIYILFSGFYTVQTSETVITTTIFGHKLVKDEAGLHYNILSIRDVIDLRKQTLLYPQNALMTESERIVTKDGKVVRVSGVLEYQIIDSYKWAIENKDCEHKLYNYLASIIISNVKELNYDELMSNRKTLEQTITNNVDLVKEEYGIDIGKFYFVKTVDNMEVLTAKEMSEASRINSETEKKVNELLKDSLNEYTTEQLDYLKTKMMCEKGGIKWVITEGQQGVMVNTQE